ncbi:uncharacterized protein LOC142930382 [Petromyzon marinus]|uniref:uncharacterized protein LOC142930382 n=1 Tax=Petromyzon marinus TaxID=7757 RepID=UPI003F7296AD
MSPARTCAMLALLAAVAFAQTEPDAAVTHAAAAAAETQGAAAVTESSVPTAVSAATAAAPLAAAPTVAEPTVAEPTVAAPTAAALAPPAVVTPPALGATLANAEAASPSSDKPDAAGTVTPPAAGTAASPAAPSPGTPLAASSSSAHPSTAAAAAATLPPTSTAPAFASSAPAATPTAASVADSSFSADVATSVRAGSPSPGTGATTPLDAADGTDGPPEAPWPVLVTQEPRSARAREGGNASLACAARGPLALLRGAHVSWHRRSPRGERVEHEAGRSELSQGDADADGEDEDEVELWAQLLLLQVLESRDEGAFYCVVTSSSGGATSHGEGSTLLVSAPNSGWRGLGDGVLGALGAACAGLGVLMGLLVALVPGVRDKLACGKSSSMSIDHV